MTFPRLRRNLLVLYAAELIGKLLGLVVFGYLGRTLLQDRYGDLEFALGVLFLLNLVIDAGLGHYGAREAAKRPADIDRLIGQVTLVRGALVGVSLLILAGIAAALPRDPLASTLILLQGLVLLPTPFVLNWVFQSRDQMHVVAAATVIRQTVLAGGVLIFVRRPEDVWMVPVWDAIGLAMGAALQLRLHVKGGGSLDLLRWASGALGVLKDSAPLAVSSVVWATRLFAPLLALGVFATSSDVGVFGAGHRLVIAVHTFVWLYFFNLLPTLSRLSTEPGLQTFQRMFTASLRLVSWVAACAASIASLVAAVLVTMIYGENLSTAGSPFAIMVWGLSVAFVSGHHRFALIALTLQGAELAASVAGAAVSVGGCLWLGTRLTPISAAWVFVVAETTTFLVAALALRNSAPQLRVFVGLARPFIFALVGTGLAIVWRPVSHPTAAVMLGSAYLLVIALLERSDLRWLVSARTGAAGR